jgi:protease-4
VRGIADGRKKNDAEIRTLIDQGPFMPEDALRLGLIDDVAYEDQVEEKLRAGERTARIDGDDYARVGVSSLGLNKGPRIAVIYAVGAISSGKSGWDPMSGAVAGSDTLIEYIRRARRDTSVRAIVLRIDSPGGSAAASDAIWRELMITKQDKADRPLVASMSDLAASGGYYVAMPAQVIVANPPRSPARSASSAGRSSRAASTKSWGPYRLDEHGQARRNQLAGAALQRRS